MHQVVISANNLTKTFSGRMYQAISAIFVFPSTIGVVPARQWLLRFLQ